MDKALIITGIVLDCICLGGMITLTVLRIKNRK